MEKFSVSFSAEIEAFEGKQGPQRQLSRMISGGDEKQLNRMRSVSESEQTKDKKSKKVRYFSFLCHVK